MYTFTTLSSQWRLDLIRSPDLQNPSSDYAYDSPSRQQTTLLPLETIATLEQATKRQERGWLLLEVVAQL